MKICIIGPSYPFRGGISHYTTLLYESLRQFHDTKFYAFKRQYPRWLFPGKTDRDNSNVAIRGEEVENLLDSFNPLSWLEVFFKIKKYNPELLIFPWWVSFWTPQFWLISYLIKKFSKTQILFICHNVVEHEANFVTKLCTKLVLRNGTHFIVHSEEELKKLKNILSDVYIAKVFHPTYAIFQHHRWSKEEAQAELGISGNTILFFGFVRPYKGLKYLIDALPEVLKRIEVTLLVVGEFWRDKDNYLRQIENLGIKDNVKIVDRYIPNEEVGLYFSACDVVVLPYTSVTGSGVVQIAFGLGKPVIASNIGSLPEVIKHGKTGYVVKPQDSQAIANAIIDFYTANREITFTREIKNQRTQFSWDRIVNTIEALAD